MPWMPQLSAILMNAKRPIIVSEWIQCQGFAVEVVQSSRRRTAVLSIREGQVQIRVPLGVSQSWVRSLLDRKMPWIRQHLPRQEKTPAPEPRQYAQGERFDFLGESLQLMLEPGGTEKPIRCDQALRMGIPQRVRQPRLYVERVLVAWYKQQALAVLNERIVLIARVIGVQPASVQVKTLKARWGSCSMRGELVFNWRIVMAPLWVLDYVVTHELCHLLHHNHSPQFWQAVNRHAPDCRDARHWLKIHGGALLR